MGRVVRISVLCLLATAAFAQFRGGFRGGGFGGGFRGGGFGHRGFVSGGFGHGGFGRAGFVGGGFGFRHSGFGNVVFPAGRFHRFGGFIGGFGFPIAYPAFGGYGYYDPYVYPYAQGPNVTVVAPYPSEPAPPVVIYERPPRAVVHEYREETAGEPEYREKIYLIAFKDSSIVAALAYWLEGDNLHYITRQREHKQAPLDRVDRAFSEQLNRDRKTDFSLPR